MPIDSSTCPRCAFPSAGEPSCPKCGVVFAKLTLSETATALQAASPPSVPARDPEEEECDSCGGPGPLVATQFRQTIGAVLLRFEKTVEGYLCSDCARSHFVSCTTTTAVAGWFGIISLVLTPWFILTNIQNYLAARSEFSQFRALEMRRRRSAEPHYRLGGQGL